MLGDRVRMGRHASDEGVFIRSMATRGQLGGVARTTGDVAEVMDASGAAVIFIETVGVGQAEVEIVRTADVSIVVFAPGSGDEVQTLKAGIMEIADIFVVNQADRAGADQLAAAIGETQALRMPGPEEWRPPILKTIATADQGVAEVWEAIQQCWARRETTVGERRRLRHTRRLRERLGDRLLARLDARLPPGEFERVVDRIAARDIDPYAAADELIDRAGERRPQPALPQHR
jgi:LAO/AO transport system kinase